MVAPEKRECLKKIPIFYKELICTWEGICLGTYCDLEFTLSQSLWDKKFVASRGKTIADKQLESKAGILIVIDLLTMMVNSALGKSSKRNLICQLLIFLSGMGFCTPFPENGKTL